MRTAYYCDLLAAVPADATFVEHAVVAYEANHWEASQTEAGRVPLSTISSNMNDAARAP